MLYASFFHWPINIFFETKQAIKLDQLVAGKTIDTMSHLDIHCKTIFIEVWEMAFAGMKSGEGGRSRMKSVCVSAWTKRHATALPASPKLESYKIAMGNSVSERALAALPRGIALLQFFPKLQLYQPQTRQCDRSVSPNTCECQNLWANVYLTYPGIVLTRVRSDMSWKLLAMLSTEDFDILWPLHRLHFWAWHVMAHVSVWMSMCLRPWTDKDLSSLYDLTWKGKTKNNVSLTPKPFCRKSWIWVIWAIWWKMSECVWHILNDVEVDMFIKRQQTPQLRQAPGTASGVPGRFFVSFAPRQFMAVLHFAVESKHIKHSYSFMSFSTTWNHGKVKRGRFQTVEARCWHTSLSFVRNLRRWASRCFCTFQNLKRTHGGIGMSFVCTAIICLCSYSNHFKSMFRVTEAVARTLVLTSQSTKLGTSVSSSGWTIAAYVFPRTTRRSYLVHIEVNKY